MKETTEYSGKIFNVVKKDSKWDVVKKHKDVVAVVPITFLVFQDVVVRYRHMQLTIQIMLKLNISLFYLKIKLQLLLKLLLLLTSIVYYTQPFLSRTIYQHLTMR